MIGSFCSVLADCTPIWYVYFGRYLNKGGHYPGPVTEEDCAEACARRAGCVGVNFDRKANPERACWLHNDKKQFASQHQAAHINLYKMKERCASKSLYSKYLLSLGEC